MKRAIMLACLLIGCSEEAPIVATPLPSTPPPRPAAAPGDSSDLIVSPHVRTSAHGRASASSLPERRWAGGGGGGGGAGDWEPRHEPPPTEREIAEYRARLEREMAERPPEHDQQPCDRFLDVIRGNAAALDRPGTEMPEGPSRAELRENCRNLPEAFRDCLSPEYFREHADECQEEIDEMAARGRRRSNAAQRELDQIRAGRRPWPGQQGAPPPRPGAIDDEEETDDG